MDRYSLKSFSDLPLPFRSFFSFRYFNSLQSECFPVCFHSDVNMVVSAPTGSGKTVLFELCILRLLSRYISDGKLVPPKGTLKTIYVAPSKALVQEKLRDWNEKFGSMGLECLELTGDNEFYSRKNIQDADVILTTPEKFDAVTRYRINDGGLSFFGDIALLLLDEVHFLNDQRGAVLEAIVSRIKMLARRPEMNTSPLSHIRILAVSATIPNIEDLAEWLNVPAEGIKRFGEEMRPVKLTTKVFGYAAAKNDFLFEKRLQNYVFDLLMQFSARKSALVFCSTRKGAQEAAQRLAQTAMTLGYSNPFIKDNEQMERLREASQSCSDKQMQSCIHFGVGFHNGGLCLKDRNLVEGLFLKGDIRVLCTTNTLAHGINLPAHTVVIKSTQQFNKEKGLYMEYDRSTILQMCGRAGRPPFDDTGMVIIMTRRETVHLYENLLNGCEMVESQLLPCIAEHLAAEIVQLTVTDIARAIEWMKCSYLYVRIKKNPGNYGVKKEISRDLIEKHMQEISVQKVNELSCNQLIWTDGDGFILKPLEPGRLMTKYYLKLDTMKHIMQIPVSCTLEDALKVVCRAEEISWIQLRRNEKKLLNDINGDKDGRLRFHVDGDKGKRKKRLQTREEKIFVLANDCLTGDPLVHELSLTQDANSICLNGSRIAKCMKEFFIFKKSYKGAVNATRLAKSFYQKLWDDSPYLLKQLPGIGMVTAKALLSMGVKSFDELAEADPRRIEIITGRKFPFGNQIKESLFSLPPKVNIGIEESRQPGLGKSKLVVTLTRISEATQPAKRHYADVIVGIEEENVIYFHEKIRVDDFTSPYSVPIFVPSPQKGKLKVMADILFEEYIGLDVHQEVQLMAKVNSSPDQRRKYQKTSLFPRPNETCIIVDDDDKHTPAPNNLSERTRRDPSIPSFNLFDEGFGEGTVVGEIARENQMTISEKNIFDLIREKARNFPSVTASTIASSVLPRKRPLDHAFKHDTELIVLDKIEVHNVPHQRISGTKEREEIGDGLDDYQNMHHQTASGVPGIKSFSEDAGPLNTVHFAVTNRDYIPGGHPFGPEYVTLKSFNEEAVFDLVRKKADQFPAITRTTIPESLARTPTQSSKNQPEVHSAPRSASKQTRSQELDFAKSPQPATAAATDHGFTTGAKDVEGIFSPSLGEPYGNPSATPKTLKIRISPPPVKMLAFDVSLMKDNTRQAERGSSGMFLTGKQQGSAIPESMRLGCSLAVASKTKEVADPVGFQSIFSFL